MLNGRKKRSYPIERTKAYWQMMKEKKNIEFRRDMVVCPYIVCACVRVCAWRGSVSDQCSTPPSLNLQVKLEPPPYLPGLSLLIFLSREWYRERLYTQNLDFTPLVSLVNCSAVAGLSRSFTQRSTVDQRRLHNQVSVSPAHKQIEYWIRGTQRRGCTQ